MLQVASCKLVACSHELQRSLPACASPAAVADVRWGQVLCHPSRLIASLLDSLAWPGLCGIAGARADQQGDAPAKGELQGVQEEH